MVQRPLQVNVVAEHRAVVVFVFQFPEVNVFRFGNFPACKTVLRCPDNFGVDERNCRIDSGWKCLKCNGEVF